MLVRVRALTLTLTLTLILTLTLTAQVLHGTDAGVFFVGFTKELTLTPTPTP